MVSDAILKEMLELNYLHAKQLLFAQTRRTFNGLKPNIMKAEIKVLPPSLKLGNKEATTLSLHITNIGDTIWNATSPYSFGMIRCGIHLLDENKNVKKRDYGRISLPDDCYPGDTVTLESTFFEPELSGKHFLAFDMVNEGVGWFRKWGSSQTIVPLTIVEKPE